MLDRSCCINGMSKRKDINETAFSIVQQATGEIPSSEPNEKLSKQKNPHAQALGRLGGLKGGKARAEKLTQEQRSEIARKAAKSRWNKENKP